MKMLNLNETGIVSGGSGQSVKVDGSSQSVQVDGRKIPPFKIPPHEQDQILIISFVVDRVILDAFHILIT